MRLANLALVALAAITLVAAVAQPARTEDDAPLPPPARPTTTVPRTASVEALRAAIAERTVFDDAEITLDPESDEMRISRDEPAFADEGWGRHTDPHLGRLETLDAAVALEARVRALSDETLLAQFEVHYPVPPRGRYDRLDEDDFPSLEPRDAVLLEIVRRGGDAWKSRVAGKLDALDAWRAKTLAAEEAAEDHRTRSWDVADAELLLTLGRLAGGPPPLRMEIAPISGPTAYPALPNVRLRVVVGGERSVTLTRGGDYRSGREQRYHVEVRDAAGRIRPARRWSSGMGGGMYSRDRMAPGEMLGTTLELGRYVLPLPPGTYTARVHYHDGAHIGDPLLHLGLVTVVSEPFEIVSTKRVVILPTEVRERVTKLVAALDPEPNVHVFEGEYGEWAHELVAPTSPVAQILLIGDPAIPVLTELAAQPGMEPRRRAWAIGMLCSLTGRSGGAGSNALGAFTRHGGGMRRVSGGGFAGSSTSTSSPGRGISAEAQLAVVASFQTLLDEWDVRTE